MNAIHFNLSREEAPTANPGRQFITAETWFDLQLTINSFVALGDYLFTNFPGCSFKPRRLTQDCVENFFGLARYFTVSRPYCCIGCLYSAMAGDFASLNAKMYFDSSHSNSSRSKMRVEKGAYLPTDISDCESM